MHILLMVIHMNRKVMKKILILVLTALGLCVFFKVALFYMPFLIAFALYLLIEPVIKFCMKKFKLKRKTSSILILIVFISAIIGMISWIIVTLISEASNLINNINQYARIIYDFVQLKLQSIDLSKLQISDGIRGVFENSTQNFLEHISEFIKSFFSNVLKTLTSIPTMFFYTIITIMSLYFISSDKIYMIDQLEHHLPENWVKSIYKHVKRIASSLGGYLKAQLILVLISFFVSLVGLVTFSFVGLNVKYPLLAAIGIGFVDALPILGSGAVMIPWAIIESCKGDIRLGIAILVLWIIMTVARQICEPRIVGKQIGIHPIFTLIAMYTGFKLCGVIGLLVGPIILIVLKEIFENVLDKGVIKSIIE